MEQTQGGMALTEEIIDHMMNPRNYGKLDDPNGVGVGYDERSGEYVIFYLATDGERIAKLSFATNGCQDTVILGSIFTEMIKEADVAKATSIARSMEEQVAKAPAKQQACSELVLTAFKAALINREHRIEGSGQEMHKLPISATCDVESREVAE